MPDTVRNDTFEVIPRHRAVWSDLLDLSLQTATEIEHLPHSLTSATLWLREQDSTYRRKEKESICYTNRDLARGSFGFAAAEGWQLFVSSASSDHNRDTRYMPATTL